LPPTLAICSADGDNGGLVSAEKEVEALKPLLEERCSAGRFQVEKLEGSGREPLADSRTDLARLLLSSPIYQRPRDVVADFAFPTLAEVEKGSEVVERLASVFSPIFCSWDDGAPSKRSFGLAGVPTPADLGGRPVLLVGNHQILGLDLGPLVREFLLERGVVARGLANADAMRRVSNGGGDNTFETFGAVPVTPRNIFKLLQKGEMTLLFPGGMREALHGPGEEYKVLWPERTDFVRVAARFGAVVVPFGGVGAEDSVQVLARSEELRERLRSVLPFMSADRQDRRKRSASLVEVSGPRPSFPIVAPKLGLASEGSPGLGDRYYFSFGEPVDLKDLDPKDKVACAEAYSRIRLSVEREMAWLLEARERDPFRGLFRRQFYERVAQMDFEGPRRVASGPLQGEAVKSYGVRAPSFPIRELSPP